MINSRKLFFPLAGLLVLVDCSSKRAIEATLPVVGAPRSVLDGLLRFTLEYNPGAAFSTRFGPYQRWVLIAAALVVLTILGHSYKSITSLGRAATAGLALVAGGAVGNLLDRLISSRGVVDFIDVGIGSSRFYIFNVADAGLSLGAALLAYSLWSKDRASPKLPTA